MFLPETKSVPALRDWAGMPPEDEPHLAALVARVRKDKALSALCEQGASLLHEKNEAGEYAPLIDWQPPAAEEAGLSLLLALAALPSIRFAHTLRHVDSSITRDTCRDIGIAVARWKSVYATEQRPIGIERALLPWFRLLGSGELYRLGRLEFVRATFQGPIIAMRRRDSSEFVLLAANGTNFDIAGYVTDMDTPGNWTAELTTTNLSVSGSVINARGLATRETRTLPHAEWETALRAGDPILEIHIPEGEPLEIEACGASLAAARAFFPSKYPNTPLPVAFVCSSWLLDPAWQERLGETANIVQFQKEGLLFPVASGRRSGLYFIFGRSDPDPATAPRDTQLQREMLRAYENDAPLRSGGMLLPF